MLLVRSEHPRGWEVLHEAGFRVDHIWEENIDPHCGDGSGDVLPTAYVVAGARGRQVDVHVLDNDLSPLWASDQPFNGALEATGSIDGVAVSCLSARMQ